ncbi:MULTISPECIES: hypothetical protein [unclassified Bradyrhizobium]|nr:MULTISPECIES: hypothetical protein [unclassified Bradyrhizobium]
MTRKVAVERSWRQELALMSIACAEAAIRLEIDERIIPHAVEY